MLMVFGLGTVSYLLHNKLCPSGFEKIKKIMFFSLFNNQIHGYNDAKYIVRSLHERIRFVTVKFSIAATLVRYI